MNRILIVTSQTMVPTGLATVALLNQLSPETALRMWLIWIAASLVLLVLDWLRKRDREERFADRPAEVRRDLLKLYRMDR